MILSGIALGLLVGILAGGNIGNLVSVRLRWAALLFIAVIVRVLTEAALTRGLDLAEALRLPLFVLTYALLLAALWANRRHPGMIVAFVGILLNGIAIIANGGYMPVWAPAFEAAGFGPADLNPALNVLLPAPIDAQFLLHAGPFGDVIPIPLPVIANVISIGDILIATGLAFFLFATLVQSPDEFATAEADEGRRLVGLAGSARLTADRTRPRRPVSAETGLAPGLAEASMLDRPAVLGGTGLGLTSPSLTSPSLTSPALAPIGPEVDGVATAAALATPAVALPGAPPIAERVRRHPYVRLALNGSFSALWVGQLVSLFGDRIHQIALAFLVLGVTDSPLAVGLVFVAATLPNLLLGPVAGALVDRWDQKEVMVVSDLLRASIVLLIPVIASFNVYLIYPLVFLLTSISVFFRPARVTVLPRIVRDDELVTANSTMWLGETLADVVGYPLAGLFVAFVGTALPLAFWIDGATYVVSALLIATMVVPPVAGVMAGAAAADEGPDRGPADADATPPAGARAPGLFGGLGSDMREGWRFLRAETVLLGNTLQGVAGQFANGVLIALAPVYARDVLQLGSVDASSAYAFLETGVGIGGLVGGFVIGLVGARIAMGRLVIVGYATWGVCMSALALTGSLPVAFGLMVGTGLANMVYVIPSQTLFQERIPQPLMARVLGFRFSLVFGAMTIAMALAGALAEVVGVAPVIGAFGLVAALGGLAGLLVPALRDA